MNTITAFILAIGGGSCMAFLLMDLSNFTGPRGFLTIALFLWNFLLFVAGMRSLLHECGISFGPYGNYASHRQEFGFRRAQERAILKRLHKMNTEAESKLVDEMDVFMKRWPK